MDNETKLEKVERTKQILVDVLAWSHGHIALQFFQPKKFKINFDASNGYWIRDSDIPAIDVIKKYIYVGGRQDEYASQVVIIPEIYYYSEIYPAITEYNDNIVSNQDVISQNIVKDVEYNINKHFDSRNFKMNISFSEGSIKTVSDLMKAQRNIVFSIIDLIPPFDKEFCCPGQYLHRPKPDCSQCISDHNLCSHKNPYKEKVIETIKNLKELVNKFYGFDREGDDTCQR